MPVPKYLQLDDQSLWERLDKIIVFTILEVSGINYINYDPKSIADPII